MEDHDCEPAQHQQKDRAHWYPTRLVDIGTTSDRTAVKLIETAKEQLEGPYVTLSHCWGNARLVTQLVQDNKATFLAELPHLPRTFEDVLVATKQLGARYIWIDSLCIVQDDEADWAKESMLMASVYRNALCNIAATGAEDSQGGLFHQRGDILSAIHVADELLMRYDFGSNEWSDTEGSPLQQASINHLATQMLRSNHLTHADAERLGATGAPPIAENSTLLASPTTLGVRTSQSDRKLSGRVASDLATRRPSADSGARNALWTIQPVQPVLCVPWA